MKKFKIKVLSLSGLLKVVKDCSNDRADDMLVEPEVESDGEAPSISLARTGRVV